MEGLGEQTSARNAASDAASCGREYAVTSGMQRKCVGGGGRGLGGGILSFLFPFFFFLLLLRFDKSNV